jgi:ABC-type branched-subunit amino acid transport system ATPase component
MEKRTTAFIDFIEKTTEQFYSHKQISIDCKVNENVLVLHDEIIKICESLKEIISEHHLSINYLNIIENDLDVLKNIFPYIQNNYKTFSVNNPLTIRVQIESHENQIKRQIAQINFNLSFFRKLNFFNNNIVAIGANGSGKTTLSYKMRDYMLSHGVVISAQRILLLPYFDYVHSTTKTSIDLKQAQTQDKSNKIQNEFSTLQHEFAVLLKHLSAENNSYTNFYTKKAAAQTAQGMPISPPRETNLDKTLKIWNSLITHRNIVCDDGMNIFVTDKKKARYSAMQMSDGEKVMLFLIIQVLQAPNEGFIIIDEPEMYLHKTILKKLWDILEKEREDCIFVYLTHDLDFASSRTLAKKVWIRSFTHPDKWDIENIPYNELPESLLMELLGSRKNILFCEGTIGSIDEKIYNILFPNYTITPVDGCSSVINYTKAFNKILNLSTKAFGIIDSDYHGTERLEALRPEGIYSISMTEPENLFFNQNFLKIFAKRFFQNEDVVEKIKKDVLIRLEKDKELQISNYVSAKINYYFKDSHVSKGNTLENVKNNYNKFNKEINIDDWFDLKQKEIDEILRDKNYNKALTIINNKGLKQIANTHFKIKDFTDIAVKLLQVENEAQDILKTHFPSELIN